MTSRHRPTMLYASHAHRWAFQEDASYVECRDGACGEVRDTITDRVVTPSRLDRVAPEGESEHEAAAHHILSRTDQVPRTALVLDTLRGLLGIIRQQRQALAERRPDGSDG